MPCAFVAVMSRVSHVSPNVNYDTRKPRKRPRLRRAEAATSHPTCLSDVDLLEQVFHFTNAEPNESDAARRILAASSGIGGLGAVVDLWRHREEEAAALGLTEERLRLLAVAMELGRRAACEPLTGFRVSSHRDVQKWARGRLIGLDFEEVWILLLRSNQRVFAEWRVARGGIHGCGLLPSDVLRPVLRCAAGAFILVHNHPSGDPSPSRDDVAMTSALRQACLAVGVTLVDHVIVSRGGSYSLGEAGLFDSFSRRSAAE